MNTPIPYHVGGTGIEEGKLVFDGDNKTLADCRTTSYPQAVQLGNAAFIARACNDHDVLNRRISILEGALRKKDERIDLLETALGMLLDWDGDNESVPEYVRKVLKG